MINMACIGVDLGGTKISAGLVKKNEICNITHKKISFSCNKKEVIQQIINAINQVFMPSVKGVGIGVPAIIDVKKGIVYEATNLGLDKVPLKRILEKKFDVPVVINNDANCFTLGEKLFGKGKGFKDMVGLIIGTGVGAGIIINGKLYYGQNCSAGEFGKIPYLKHDMEYYCSGKFFQKEYKIDGEDLFHKAVNNDKKAKNIFNTYGKHLGKALSVIINSVDPQIIVLGGSVSKSYNFFMDSMNESLRESTYRKNFQNIRITVSTSKNIAILGAASLIYLKN